MCDTCYNDKSTIYYIMKKLLIALLSVMLLCGVASAKNTTEFTFSYGGYTQMDAGDCADGWDDVNNAWGALNVGLNFKILPNVWIGPSYTFSSTTTKGGPKHSNIAYHVIMLNGRYEYYHNSIVKMYGHVGIGSIISHLQPRKYDSYNKGYFAIQISPICAQVDLNRQWAIFGELGFGAQGLIQVGGKLRF